MSESSDLSADDFVARNADYAKGSFDPDVPGKPHRRVAVVACMDSRLDVPRLLGLEAGDAHVIRNAGGVMTDDVIRSLSLSQRALGTVEIILVHHTRCGLQNVDEAGFLDALEADSGERPAWAVGGFADAHVDTRESIDRLRASPFLAHTDHIRGFVYDVDTGLLDEVHASDS